MSLDGLITFFASHHAIRAEKVLGETGFEVQLVPGPKELSPNCGTALRFDYATRTGATAVLSEHQVEIDEVIEYVPRTDRWHERSRSAIRGRRRE